MAAPSRTELTDGLSTVTRGTLFVIFSTLCLVLFSSLSRVLLVRSITPGGYWGSFSLGLALAGVLSSVGALGLPNAVARSIPYAASDAERRSIVRASLAASIASAAILGGLLWLLAHGLATFLRNPQLALGVEFFSVAIGASIVATLLASVFQGYSDVTPNALFVQILNPGLFLAFLGIAYATPSIRLTYTSALAAYSLANVATVGALAVYALGRLPLRLPPGPRAAGASRRLFQFAAPLLVAGAMASLAGFGDTLVLGAFHSGQVGIYTATLTLARLLQIGINAASYIFLPVAARFLRRGNRGAVRLTYSTVTKWMVLLSMPLFLLFFFLPGRSLGFVYGPQYTAVVLPLQCAVLGAFLATLLGPAASTQVAYGRAGLLAYNSIAAGAADVGIAFALVPRYGYVGAGIAWGSANLVYAGLCLAELAYLDQIHPFRRDYMLPLAATVLPLSLLLLPFPHRIPEWALPPIGLAAAGVFILVVIATGSIDEGDGLLLGAVESLLGWEIPLVRRLGRWARRRGRGA